MTLLKKLFKKKQKFYIKPEHKVEIAFTESNGINNYRFESGFNIPSKRALCAFDYYNEFNMGCDSEFLNKFVDTIKEIINDKKSISFTNIIRMVTILEERVKYIRPKNLYLQIAAVATFDETEDPYTFDYDYARKKIERWSKDEAILDFFLKTNIGGLIPQSKNYEGSSKNYFEIMERITKEHYRILTSISSKNKSTSELMSS